MSRNSPVRYERVQPAPREGVWSMEIFKPEVGAYEDHTITVRGVPGWLFVSEGRYWK